MKELRTTILALHESYFNKFAWKKELGRGRIESKEERHRERVELLKLALKQIDDIIGDERPERVISSYYVKDI